MVVVRGGIIILLASISWLEGGGLWIEQIPVNVQLRLNGGRESCAAFVMLSWVPHPEMCDSA